MAKKDKFYMPMGTGGLLRYQEEGEELFKIKPKHVVFIVLAIAIFEIILQFIPK